jgi:hypothetical protein
MRAEVARFDATHPGIGASNYPDAFRAADGSVVEGSEFDRIDRSTGSSKP